MKNIENWDKTRENFKAWWKGESFGRPLMYIVAKRDVTDGEQEPEIPFKTPEEFHLDVAKKTASLRNRIKTHKYMGDAFPSLDINIGPGSMTVYLGSEPVFSWDTVWYKEVVEDWNRWGLIKYDPDNYWWKKHLSLIKYAKEISGEDFLVNIPDIIENVDILSAMRGPQEFCYDLMDEPGMVKNYVEQIDDLYFKYYDSFYETVKLDDDSSSYTAFQIWGSGKTAKLQCDFSAMMSPTQFREFIQPSLRKQCQRIDNTLYHLDGPDAVKHLDALMEIKELSALQWTSGAGKPDTANEQWYHIYDKVKDAGKSLWVNIYDGEFKDWMESAQRMVDRYGSAGLYLLFPVMSERDADILLNKAIRSWRD